MGMQEEKETQRALIYTESREKAQRASIYTGGRKLKVL